MPTRDPVVIAWPVAEMRTQLRHRSKAQPAVSAAVGAGTI
jgi:hypothetical protein